MPRSPKLLWIAALNQSPSLSGYSIETVTEVQDALERLDNCVQAVVAEWPLPGWTHEDALEILQRTNPKIPVVLCDPEMSPAKAVRLARMGAHQCFGTDTDPEEFREMLDSAIAESFALEYTHDPQEEEPWARLLIGESAAMQEVKHVIRLVGAKRCTVLVTGETGTGKEMAARALHMASGRAALPMVAVNCSALPETLLEAELFGYVKGAFTGAVGQRTGRFEEAHNSTIFLDEIGDMPLEVQAKLLRVLQERELQRLGSSETIRVDVRVIAASNSDLLEKVRQRQFREDLYYRLNVVPVRMPAVRERVSDIPLLARHFIDKICRAEGIPARTISPELMTQLRSHHWPGNVRELENSIERAIVMSGDRVNLYPSDFPFITPPHPKVIAINDAPGFDLPPEGLHLESAMDDFARRMLAEALKRSRGNKTLAADMLGMKRTTFISKLRSLEEKRVPLDAYSA
ncbi:MAG: sigma-54 dependent transcriptional regulator [Bryobacteraceae bacterium]